MMVRLKVRGLKQAMDKLNRTAKAIDQEMTISDFGEQVREKVIEGIQANTGHHGGYHTYKSDHPGALEESVRVAYPGKGRLMVTAYAPHAQVVEEGRRAISGKWMAFRGYYPNPRMKGKKGKYGRFTVLAHHVRETRPKKYMYKTYLWMSRKMRKYFEIKMKQAVDSDGQNINVAIQKL